MAVSSHTLAVESMLRCHLTALVRLAGSNVPPPLKSHVDVAALTGSSLTKWIEVYQSFLRSPRSLS